MKAPIAVLATLIAVGGVAALIYYSPGEPDPIETPLAGPETRESRAPIQAPRRPSSASAVNTLPDTDRPAETSPGLSIEHRIFTATQTGTKIGYRDVLKDWRSGRLTREQDRAVGDLVGSVRSSITVCVSGRSGMRCRTSKARRSPRSTSPKG